MPKKANGEPTVERRLYSLYPEHVRKLKELAKGAGIPQSEYLRELIDVEYARKAQLADRYTSATDGHR